MQRTVWTVLLATSLVVSAWCADWSNRVERLLWVVGDTKAVSAGWEHLGLLSTAKSEQGSFRFTGPSGPTSATLRWTTARLGDTIVDFVEPQDSSGLFGKFHQRHKDGVMALVHRVETESMLAQEIARLKALGVGVLLDYRVRDGRGEAHYVLFDTEGQGKYVLGLICVNGEYPEALAPPPLAAGASPVTQYAFAVKDLDAVSAYWQKLGWPAMTVTNPDLLDLEYRGKPEQFAMRLGWYRHTKVPYEWILSVKEPNVYADHMRVHGEGVHHLAFNVDDMDAAIAQWAAKGFPTSQSGSWGERGKPGSGRFAYQDTQRIGGIDIELLWNYRARSGE